MRKFIINDKGITLIELIVSITILSVVMISIFTFFTNAFRVNSINSDDIQAMNVAREQKTLLNDHSAAIKELLYDANMSVEQANDILRSDDKNIYEVIDSTPDEYIFEVNNQDYDISLTIDKIPIDHDSQNTEEFNQLHKVHVKVEKNRKILSETYTFFVTERVR